MIATAIHDGHGLRPEVERAMVLSREGRLREEDPFTGQAVEGVATHVIAGHSRFEVDLNRSSDAAVYRTPEQSWGLEVWRAPPADDLVEGSLRLHRNFYRMMEEMLRQIAEEHGRFLLLDVHSYNHRRDGPEADSTPQEEAPDINIGTFSMPRERWAWLLDPLMEEMREFDFAGRKLDVRENVAFQGKGELTRFVHQTFPEAGCAIAIEFKKFFMDEWTGEPFPEELAAMRELISHVAAKGAQLLHAA